MKRWPLTQLAIVVILVVVATMSRSHARLSLAVIGSVAVIGAIMVERRHQQIWRTYKKAWRPGKSTMANRLSEPREIYHQINVYILWPSIFVLGLVALFYAVKG